MISTNIYKTWVSLFLAGCLVLQAPQAGFAAADKTAPVVSAPADITATITGTSASLDIGQATATDDVGVVSLSNDAPLTYPLGTTTVTWTAVDAAGNTGSDSQVITVEQGTTSSITTTTSSTSTTTETTSTETTETKSSSDDDTSSTSASASAVDVTPPTVKAPPDIKKQAKNSKKTFWKAARSKVNIGMAEASDDVGVVSLTNNAPKTFPMGDTVVTWTAEDAAGNTSTDTQMVTLTPDDPDPDTTAPVVTAPADVVAEATGTSSPVDIGNATATDDRGVASLTNNAPSAYPLGTTTVTWTATDEAGNTGTDTQTVNVQDTTPPTITAPADINTSTPDTSTTVNLGAPVTSDNVAVASVTNDAPSSFPLGSTTVTWTAVDTSGNTSTDTQTVTVTQSSTPDTTPPVVTAPTDVVAEATGTSTSVNIGNATATDNVGVTSLTSDAPASYPLGTTTVTWTAKDAAGNTGTDTQMVSVQDTTPPSITAPADVAESTTGTSANPALGTPTTSDNVAVASVTNDAPSSFPLGTTTVTWTAVDTSGNTSTDTQNVTVTQTSTPDTTPPVVTAPSDVVAEATGTSTSVNIGNATATDNVGVTSLTSNAPASYPLGTTTVTWTAKDAAGNTGTDTQTVSVQDTTPPSITAPADVAETTSGTSATPALGTPTTSDNVAVASVTNDAPSSFPLGTTTVTWTAVDTSGNTSTDTQDVTVTQSSGGTPVTLNFRNGQAPTSGYSGTRDSYLRQTSPSAQNGDSLTIEADGSDQDPNNSNIGELRGVIAWDISTIPQGSTVNSATITFNVDDSSSSEFHLYEIKTPWAESSVSWDTLSGSGAIGTTVVGTLAADASGESQVNLNSAGTNLVQGWVSGSIPNNGLILIPAGGTDGVDIHAREASTVSNRPQLTVSYTTDGSSSGDTIPPVVTAPADITQDSTGTLTQVNLGNATATDNVGVVSLTNNAPSQGFPVGTTVVTWTALDAAGNQGTDTQSVTINPGSSGGPVSDMFVNVKDFGAKGDGDADDTDAIQAAVDSVYSQGGGTVYFPPGEYKVAGHSSGDSFQGQAMKTGIHLREMNGSSPNPQHNLDHRVILRGSGMASVIEGDSDNLVVIRISTSHVAIKDLTINGGSSYGDFNSRTVAIGLIPQNMQDTTTPSYISHNLLENLHIRDAQEGIMIMCGPNAAESTCHHNSISRIVGRFLIRGIYLASGVSGSPAPMMNHFEHLIFNHMNNGLHIESGSSNTFVHTSINDMDLFASSTNDAPRLTPTAMIIEGTDKWGLWSNSHNRFYSVPNEGNQLDFENNNSTTEIYGNRTGSDDEDSKWNVTPQILLGARDQMMRGPVYIGKSDTNAHPAVILGIESTEQGFLLPPLSNSDRSDLGSVPEGLVIYNTSSDTLEFYNGSEWKEVDLQ